MSANKIRRYDLDWLRVLVFALLILYHVGMFFVPWGWHIKNGVIYDWLRWPMVFVNQWRLPILFVISGMGTYYALGFRSGWQFTKERFFRLYIPLAFGMLFIVPPQVYIERLHTGDFVGNYWEYFTTVAFSGIYPEGNFSWHHLWFLPYLLCYSLLFAPLFVYLRKHPDHIILRTIKKWISKPFGLYVFIIPLYLAEAFLEPFFPTTHALIDDWFNFTSSGFFFLFGFLLIACGQSWWSAIDRIKQTALRIGVIAFTIQVCIWLFLQDGVLVHFTEALIKVMNLWSWIIVLFAYAAKYLNKPSDRLTYANQAVYPFYILHQTITILLAYPMINWSAPLFVKFMLLSLGTFLGSWLIYEFLIRRVKWIRPLFGVKQVKRSLHLKRQGTN